MSEPRTRFDAPSTVYRLHGRRPKRAWMDRPIEEVERMALADDPVARTELALRRGAKPGTDPSGRPAA